MAISMGFGDFYNDPNVEVNSPWLGSPKAQLIMHCLQDEVWQSPTIMHWVKSANSRKHVDQ
jgi:hypothetical protein